MVAFGLQTFGSRAVLERFGLGLATASPSIALMAGSVASLVTPGFGSLLVARGGEASFRASWFRAGYELFYTPLAARERRAAKSLIDVALDRVSDALGGGLVRAIIALVPVAYSSSTLLFGAMVCSAGALLAASHLNRWYIRTLEHSLLDQGSELDLSDTRDGATTRVLFDLRQRRGDGLQTDATTTAVKTRIPIAQAAATAPLDPLIQDILTLRDENENDQEKLAILARADGLARPLVSHVIPLLASNALGDYAVFALRKVAEEHVGELTDALIDPNQPLDVRRRIARVCSVCVSQRAVEGLILALDDATFEVRFQAARSLTAIVEKNPNVIFEREQIESIVLKEIEEGRPFWEGQPLLDDYPGTAALDLCLRERAAKSLAHVFALLSLIIPREPLQIAFRSMHVEDHHLRGTALEYLEGILPPAVRQRLWPFLLKRRAPAAAQTRPEAAGQVLPTAGFSAV
jgi:ATP:ADP antiporter, AAA family